MRPAARAPWPRNCLAAATLRTCSIAHAEQRASGGAAGGGIRLGFGQRLRRTRRAAVRGSQGSLRSSDEFHHGVNVGWRQRLSGGISRGVSTSLSSQAYGWGATEKVGAVGPRAACRRELTWASARMVAKSWKPSAAIRVSPRSGTKSRPFSSSGTSIEITSIGAMLMSSIKTQRPWRPGGNGCARSGVFL